MPKFGRSRRTMSWAYYKAAYRYIYFNPVEAGICDRAEKYPFSSLPYVLVRRDFNISVTDNMNLISDPKLALEWINFTTPLWSGRMAEH